MATEILTPQDCLKGRSFNNSAFSNRRRTSVNRQAVHSGRTPSPKPPRKSNRKSSPSLSSSSSFSASSMIESGFRILKRGESFAPSEKPIRSGSDLAGLVEKKDLLRRFDAESEPETAVQAKSGVFNTDKKVETPVQTKTSWFTAENASETPVQTKSNRFTVDNASETPVQTKSGRFRPIPAGSTTEPGLVHTKKALESPVKTKTGRIFAGPVFTAASPEPSSLPLPKFICKSKTSEDEASKTLINLLKLNIL